MINKVQIRICLGSSCFSRGNNELVKQVQKYIRHANLEGKVAFMGDHCTGNCNEGPNIRIAGKLINGITPENIAGILEANLKELQ